MFEKPQYPPPDGSRRSTKNPAGSRKALHKSAQEKTPLVQPLLTGKSGVRAVQKGISPEAAKLIAQAIKGMLHE